MANPVGFGFLNLPGDAGGQGVGQYGQGAGQSGPMPTDNTALLQAILGQLQILTARLAPEEMFKSIAFNNSSATATIQLNGSQVFNGLVWALTGGMVYVYFDIIGNQPDFILTPTTDEKFLPDIVGKTQITFVPQAAVTGTAYLMRY